MRGKPGGVYDIPLVHKAKSFSRCNVDALNAIGVGKLNDYLLQDDCFDYWGGSARVFEGRHHYWTDEELGIDA